jgi:hypothetical protein
MNQICAAPAKTLNKNRHLGRSWSRQSRSRYSSGSDGSLPLYALASPNPVRPTAGQELMILVDFYLSRWQISSVLMGITFTI